MVKVKPVQNGRTTRMSFSHINEVIGMPNLIEIQKNSYNWFLEEGLHEVFHDIAAIEDYTGNLVLEFVDYRLDKNPKYSIKECKERDATYAAPLYVTARLFNKQTGEVKEQEIFMGDFPLMTDAGTFISNGAERAIVSQLVRSWACPPMSRSSSSSAIPSRRSTPLSKRTSPTTPRRACSRSTVSCAPVSPRRWRTPART